MDPPIAHFNEAIAFRSQTAIVRGHQQGDAFGARQIKQ